MVFVHRVEQVASARFDDRMQFSPLKVGARGVELLQIALPIRVEARVIERDRDAAIPQVGEQIYCRRQAVMCQLFLSL